MTKEKTESKPYRFLTKVLSEKASVLMLYIGFILLVASIILFSCKDLFYDFGMLGSDHIAQFGDLVGGLIGSIWALAGVILFYVALRDQRKDFETNRDALLSQNNSINLQTDAINSQNRSIELQLEEIKLQTEANKQTQIELENQKKEFQIQNKTLSIQRFENTFFQLLGIHNNIVENMETKYFAGQKRTITDSKNNLNKNTESLVKGRNTFKIYYQIYLREQFIKYFRDEHLYPSENGEVNTQVTYYTEEYLLTTQDIFGELMNRSIKDNINTRYNQLFFKVQTNLSHYYRNLYRIFKFIDTKEFVSKVEIINDKEFKVNKSHDIDNLYKLINNSIRYQYSSMIRAQLSDYELWWLTFNCLWEKGEKFWIYVEKYSVLKNHPDKQFMKNLVKLGLYTNSSIDKSWNNNIYNFQLYDNLIQKDKSSYIKGDKEYIDLGITIKHYID